MSLTHEELAAYADGELEGAEAARVLMAVAANAELMRTVNRYRVLRERIGAEFAPILEQEVPERLAALLRPPEERGELDRRREARAQPLLLTRPAEGEELSQTEPAEEIAGGAAYPRWLILPVLAAALAVAAFLPSAAVVN